MSPGSGASGAEAFGDLAAELERLFTSDVAALDDPAFDHLAMRVFAFQARENAAYGAFAAGRGATPDSVERWEDCPPVPAAAFKHLDLVTGDPEGAEAVFRTSGTTAGGTGRGRHLVRRLGLYRSALLPPFRRHLLPDGARVHLLALVPEPRVLPDSSLSYMVAAVGEELAEGVSWLLAPDGRVDLERFRREAAELTGRAQPVLVAATALALVDLVESLGAAGEDLRLPEGSRIMETGGFKGRRREVGREELYAAVERRLGVPAERIVNEYGMTELLSQLYEPVLSEGASARGRHLPPPWLRVRALDPTTLGPRPRGRSGLLAFFDLANLGSVSHVLTEDVGWVSPDGVRLLGRVQGAELRGCSLALEELAAAAARIT